MSKSLGNFLLIKDVLRSYHPEAVRIFLLSSHYRSPIDFTDKAMDEATVGLDKVYAVMERVEEMIKAAGLDLEDASTDNIWARFCEAMDDDFNTARGLGILFDTVRHLNRILDETGPEISSQTCQELQSARQDMLRIASVLGILTDSPRDYFAKKRSMAIEKKSIDPEIVEKMVYERSAARKARDWEKADRIRNQLEAMNVILEDRADGTVWKIKE
jgi:cysteinyl-tRNA synthetase